MSETLRPVIVALSTLTLASPVQLRVAFSVTSPPL